MCQIWFAQCNCPQCIYVWAQGDMIRIVYCDRRKKQMASIRRPDPHITLSPSLGPCEFHVENSKWDPAQCYFKDKATTNSGSAQAQAQPSPGTAGMAEATNTAGPPILPNNTHFINVPDAAGTPTLWGDLTHVGSAGGVRIIAPIESGYFDPDIVNQVRQFRPETTRFRTYFRTITSAGRQGVIDSPVSTPAPPAQPYNDNNPMPYSSDMVGVVTPAGTFYSLRRLYVPTLVNSGYVTINPVTAYPPHFFGPAPARPPHLLQPAPRNQLHPMARPMTSAPGPVGMAAPRAPFNGFAPSFGRPIRRMPAPIYQNPMPLPMGLIGVVSSSGTPAARGPVNGFNPVNTVNRFTPINAVKHNNTATAGLASTPATASGSATASGPATAPNLTSAPAPTTATAAAATPNPIPTAPTAPTATTSAPTTTTATATSSSTVPAARRPLLTATGRKRLPDRRPPITGPAFAAASAARQASRAANGENIWTEEEVTKLLLLRSRGVGFEVISRDYLFMHTAKECEEELKGLGGKFGFEGSI